MYYIYIECDLADSRVCEGVEYYKHTCKTSMSSCIEIENACLIAKVCPLASFSNGSHRMELKSYMGCPNRSCMEGRHFCKDHRTSGLI